MLEKAVLKNISEFALSDAILHSEDDVVGCGMYGVEWERIGSKDVDCLSVVLLSWDMTRCTVLLPSRIGTVNFSD